MLRSFFAVAANVIVAFILVPLAQGQSLADKLPAGACLMLSVEQAADFSAKWQQSEWGAMLAAPAWQPLYAQLEKEEMAAPLYPRPWLGLNWSDIARFPGPAALAVLADKDKQPALLLLMHTPNAAGQVKECLIQGEKYFESQKAKRTVEKVGDAELVIYEIAATKERALRRCVQMTSGDYFICSSSREVVEGLLKGWAAGEKGSLAADGTFQKVSNQAAMLGESSAGAFFFVRPLELVELLQPKAQPGERGVKNWGVMFRKQGLDGVQGLGGTLSLAEKGPLDAEITAVAIAPHPFAKSLRMATLIPGAAVPPPAWVEAEASSFVTAHWDMANVFEGVGDWLGEKYDDPGFFAAYLADLRLDKQVDVPKEIVARVGPVMMRVEDMHGTKDKANPTGWRMMTALEGRNQANLAKGLLKVVRTDGGLKTEMIDGTTFASVPRGESILEEPPAGEPPDATQTGSLAVSKTQALFSSDASWLKSKLAAKPAMAPLADDSQYKLLAAWTEETENKQTSLRSFVRLDDSLRTSYAAAGSGPLAKKAPWQTRLMRLALLGEAPADSKTLPATLPKYELLVPHLHPSATLIGIAPQGFEIHAASLRSCEK